MRYLSALLLLALSPLVEPAAVVPTAPKVEARAHLLMDFHSGRILTQNNVDERMEPASLTKMMSAYAVFAELREGNIRLDDQVRASVKAWRMEGSRMFIEPNKLVSVEDLLHGMIIQSGNDASVALAEHVAGDETAFADLMNRYSKRMGLTGSNFTNASGLPDPEHYTTARDMAAVASAMIREFPEEYMWHAIKEYEYNGISQRNRNKLLWQDESVDGLKTGYTRAAGYCLVASAVRDQMRLISVVLGAESVRARTRQSRALLTYGFRFFETRRLYAAQTPVTTLRVWKGDAEQLGMGLSEDLYVTVPRGQYKNLDATMEIDRQILAPVGKGARHGIVRVKLAGEGIAERPLVALHAVSQGSLWQQLSDHVRLMFE